jgi:beta-phosphoglucomutase
LTRHYDAILFDFDGVLADTEPIHWKCWVEVLAPLPIDLPWDIYAANCIGVQDHDMLPFLASISRAPVTVEALEPYYLRKRDLFRRRVLEAGPIAADTVELIRSLDGYRLGLVTSSERLEVEPVIEGAGLRDCFSVMVFGEDVECHKPSPEPYLLAASRLGAKRPLVVEDSAAGVASARAAGFMVIQVTASSAVPTRVRLHITQQVIRGF